LTNEYYGTDRIGGSDSNKDTISSLAVKQKNKCKLLLYIQIYIYIVMKEEVLEDWFDLDLFDVGLDEYLTQLFKELDERDISNANNFQIME
jgi:hypothetical protein